MQDSTPKVWLADLDEIADTLGQLDIERRVLSSDERAALSGHRAQARALLRLLLRSEGLTARIDAPLPRTMDGRPMLPEASAGGADFSVSHSGCHALIAISRIGRCGVDIEGERQVHMKEARISLLTSSGLALAINGSAVAESARGLTAWTCLEAFAKACGRGIGAVLMEVGATAEGARSVEAVDAAQRAKAMASRDRLSVAVLEMPAGLHAALAAEREALKSPPVVQRITQDDVRALASA